MKKDVTVIIPTMWKSKDLPQLLNTLYDSNWVQEVLLIDNNPTARENYANTHFKQNLGDWHSIINHHKLKIIYEGPNLYVNPSWNLGIKKASNDWIIFSNDDLVFDMPKMESILYQAKESDGIIGTGPHCYEFRRGGHVLPESPIINQLQGGRKQGWGCLIIIHKNNFQPIPEDIKINCGDDWLQLYSDHNIGRSSVIEGMNVRASENKFNTTIRSLGVLDLAMEDIKIWRRISQDITWDPNQKKLIGKYIK